MDEKSTNSDPATEARAAGARTAESRAFQKSGIDLLIRFHIVDKIAKIYDTGNDAFLEQGRLFHASLTAVFQEEDEASFAVRHGALLLNGKRLRFGVGTYGIFKSVLEEFRTRDVGSVTFRPGLTEGELSLIHI